MGDEFLFAAVFLLKERKTDSAAQSTLDHSDPMS
jgi:hypothetical protein